MDGLFNLREQAISISEQLKAQAESPQQSERSTATIGKVLAFILGAAALFHLPPEFAGDLKWYRAWIIDSPRLPPSETRLLPAPYAVEPKPPTPENPTEGTAGATSGGTEDGIAP
jgi:hypothetical protein